MQRSKSSVECFSRDADRVSSSNPMNVGLTSDAGRHIDAYLEYRRVVGDDDDGQLMSPEEYEHYKKTVIPQRMKNRIFVSWTNSAGMDCKLVGPETACFCGHRYKQHQTDFETLPNPIRVPCRVSGCRCENYHYVPANGSQSIRCSCKHPSDEHRSVRPYKCTKCAPCPGFRSSYTCSCGEPTFQHMTLLESKEERAKRGHPVGYDVPYQAMGGLTGFSSLAEGYQRLDPSGVGAPPRDVLDAPIGHNDHPVLRQFAALEVASGSDRQSSEAAAMMRQPGEGELDYYERMYQARNKRSQVYTRKPAARRQDNK